MGDNQNPLGTILQMATGLLASRALWAAAHFKIADHVTKEGIALDELAAKTGILPDRLRRLMHVLVNFGVFRVSPEERVEATPMSDMLRSDSDKSVRSWVESIIGNEHYEALGLDRRGADGADHGLRSAARHAELRLLYRAPGSRGPCSPRL